MSKVFNQYFSRYAESEVAVLTQYESGLPDEFTVDHVVVIPAYQETSAFIERFLASSLSKSPVLMVLVINEPITESIAELIAESVTESLREDNSVANYNEINQQKALYQYALSCGDNCWQYDNLTLIKVAQSQTWLLVVDRFTRAIDKEQGVGLARKIGTDLSAYLISVNRIRQTWICSSDADAYLPDDYFNALHTRDKNTVVCCFNFTHSSEDKSIHQANFLYESALRYYVAGLHYADSPYAFFTIGSILAFKAEVYVQARGFPKRSAGEDFYLINKLAKLGAVEFIEEVTVKLDARTSQRVPFGTGPAVQKILDLQASHLDYCYYHPQVFTLLKAVLSAFANLWHYRGDLIAWLEPLSEPIVTALNQIGFEAFVEKQINNSEKQFNKQLVVWFDAFKTLKFIHNIRENHYQDIPLAQALLTAPFRLK
ncbi:MULTISPECIES: hypothetical protein [unclassified Colwellia]|uniref:hypothetical protein n=1 Tax=unclassified Colwellia TaxID=196834 RepID=UPI0015F50554|nr:MULTISPECIES: hypothetical protein [unclassified Colwellia]MBA6353455.1 hypothetical protein [Colwellia sp. BRX9-1]MBA6357403.1 hypothetical protein [Colwellia sp. BRX8-3]MBA6359813.1 hypothetical protein [Colwellia sp. BRX8-6]MBA6368333.1 hypothetical protein [Colwellia sp. BRX8-5]MBA6373953.1 hypothetical protein [Colwellia sp. BRX8-2]